MTVRIGMEGATGIVSVDDENLGFRLALREAPVEYRLADRDRPLAIAGSARRLREHEGVHLLLNFYGGPASNEVAQLANTVGLPYLFPHTFLLPRWAGRYVFTSYPRFEGEMQLWKRFFKQKGWERICVMRAPNVYGDLYADGLGTLPSILVPDAEPASLGPELQGAREMHPDAVVLALYPTQAQRVMEARAATGWKDACFITAGPLTDEWSLVTPAADAEGVVGFCYFPDPERSHEPGVEAYRRAMRRAHPGHRLNRYSLYGYAYGLLTLEALRRCCYSPRADDLVRALESISHWDSGGIMPPVTFSPTDHHAQHAGMISEVRDGRLVPITDWIEP